MRVFSIFYLNHTPTTQFYTLSLHDALPISELREGLTKLAAKFGFIREIRGEGLMIGVELSVEGAPSTRSEEHTSELQSHSDLVCRLLLEKKKRMNALVKSWFADGLPSNGKQ